MRFRTHIDAFGVFRCSKNLTCVCKVKVKNINYVSVIEFKKYIVSFNEKVLK